MTVCSRPTGVKLAQDKSQIIKPCVQTGGLLYMSWRFAFSFVLALAYLVWICRGLKAYTRIEGIFCLVGSIGILIHLTCLCISRLPSQAPLRTVAGLAMNRSFLWFDHSHSDFLLLEAGSDRRTLFTTEIDGPWADQPIQATYVDDGRFMPSVVKIEVLRDDQLPWHVRNGSAGWVGTAEAKRQSPLILRLIAFVLILAGVYAPTSTMDRRRQIRDSRLEASAG